MRASYLSKNIRKKGETEAKLNLTLRLREHWLRWATVLIAFLGVVAAFIAGYVALGQLGVMKKQLDQMQADQRPWVKIESDKIDFLKFERENTNVGVTLSLKNVGHTPAVGVELNAELHVLTQELFQHLDDKQREVCNRGQLIYSARTTGMTLFPDETSTLHFSAATPTREILQTNPAFKHGVSFVIYGCIDYLLSSTNAHGQTGLRFGVSKAGPNGLPYLIHPELGTIGPGGLLMSKDLYGNDAK